MSNYDDTNKGAVWKNDDKKTANHPDFKGSLNVEGVDYWVSGWLRDPEGNPKAPSLKFSIQKKDAETTRQAAEPANADFDDSIPFAPWHRGQL